MVAVKQIFLASLPALAIAGDAKENHDTPAGYEVVAEFPEDGAQLARGSVKFTGLNNGSVQVDVDLHHLPSSGGPFLYHIHQAPVPANGSCAATLAHFNPNNGNATDCPAQHNNAGCELGDLSGKHGFIYDQSVQLSYVDEWLSLNPSNEYYFADGKRSLTIHYKNTTRIACANFKVVSTGNSSNDTSSSSSAVVSTATDNWGNKVGVSGGAAIFAAAAALLA